MELYVDNKKLDTDAQSSVAVSLAVAAVTDPRKSRAGYTRTLRVPATPTNDAILGWAGEIHARDGFNTRPHTGRVEHEGAVLIEGPLYLSRTRKGEYYELHIIGASKEWVRGASARRLSDTPIPWTATLTGSTIASSWTAAGAVVRFFPVAREKRELDYSSGSVIPAVKVLSTDDYHPFLHVGSLLRAIFAQNGYTMESDLFASFDNLYISGNYPTKDVAVLKANMDFLARRALAGSVAANSQGRVYANPYQVGFTLGNIVDVGAGEDTFSNGGYFQMDGERIAFIPTTPVTLGFQYHLRYTTDYRMKSRTELAGFNEVYLGEQASRKFSLVNPYPDRRASFRPGRSYKLAVFSHMAGRDYVLKYTRTDATESYQVSQMAGSAAFSNVTIPDAVSVSPPELYYRNSPADGANFVPYTGDWALYDGFVGETGTMDVELTLRTAPENVSLSAPKFFNSIWFGGAEPGMKITLSEKTWLRPVFYAQPTEGTRLTFADVCAHDATQMDLIDALRQMFNLYFQTDNRGKMVRVESETDFHAGWWEVDWTGRIDLGKPIEVEELGADLSREMVWSYRTGDGAVSKLNRADGGQMGKWSARVENTAAADAVSVWENPLFTPSLNAARVYQGAPSALIVQAGNNEADVLERTENLNFLPKIVRYEGMKALPTGETWGWPQVGDAYPKIAFHAPESNHTLCFEDRDGCVGLHIVYDRDVRLWNNSRRVTLWLAMEAVDVESIDFRKFYRLTIDGEPGLYQLEEICDYTPGAPSTKCVFIKHIP